MFKHSKKVLKFTPYIYRRIYLRLSLYRIGSLSVLRKLSLISYLLIQMKNLISEMKQDYSCNYDYDPRRNTFRDIKGFFASRGLSIPKKVLNEYSDILDID